MNFLRLTLVMVMLLCIAMIAGCQEGHARKNHLTQTDKVVWDHTTTGFWHARVSPLCRRLYPVWI